MPLQINMKKYLRYFSRISRMSLMQPLMYPKDFLWSLFTMPLHIFISIAAIYFVVAVSTGQTVAQMDAYKLVFVSSCASIIWTFIAILPLGSGLIGFQIISGVLDKFILKPFPLAFMAIFQKFYIQKPLFIAMHSIVCADILLTGHVILDLYSWSLLLFVMLSSGILIISIFAFGEALNFRYPKNTFTQFFCEHADNFANYPANIYPTPLRFFFIFILPAFLIGNPIYEILQGTYSLNLFLITIVLMIFWAGLAFFTWKNGIKAYASAN